MTRVHIASLSERLSGRAFETGGRSRSMDRRVRPRPAEIRSESVMSKFDEREKEFEARFKHDQEFAFKVTARRNKLLGLWAAEHLGLVGGAAEAYAKEVVAA